MGTCCEELVQWRSCEWERAVKRQFSGRVVGLSDLRI